MSIKAAKGRELSVAEARRELPALIRLAESGKRIVVTRRGKPVAVLVSMDDYQRISPTLPKFSEAYGAWRASVAGEHPDAGPEFFEGVRDTTQGRDVELP